MDDFTDRQRAPGQWDRGAQQKQLAGTSISVMLVEATKAKPKGVQMGLGLRYNSVRCPGSVCWALMTPRPVTSIIQTAHYEMIWSSQIISVNRITTSDGR